MARVPFPLAHRVAAPSPVQFAAACIAIFFSDSIRSSIAQERASGVIAQSCLFNFFFGFGFGEARGRIFVVVVREDVRSHGEFDERAGAV